jgi:hypothetical protein
VPSALSDVREQRDLARPFHGHRQLTLVGAGKAGDSTAARLPLVGEETAQKVKVLVVDYFGVDPRVFAGTGAVGATAAPTGASGR